RAASEADAMQRILNAQRTAIEKELKRRQAERDAPSAQQLRFDFLPEEKDQKEQYEIDTSDIEKRLRDLPRELKTEPQRIRDLYDVKHHRVERVGLVYLWPATS